MHLPSRLAIAVAFAALLTASVGGSGAASAADSNAAVVGAFATRAILENRLRDLVPFEGGFVGIAGLGDSASSLEVLVGLRQNSLAGEQLAREARGLPHLSAAGERDYIASLAAFQAPLIGDLEAAGARVLFSYQRVVNGIAVRAPPGALPTIATLPGVASIQGTRILERALDTSVPFIFGGKSHTALGADGTGVVIAIIDTGIDYTHAAFGAIGNPIQYAINDPTFVEAGTFPTPKVVGGTDLVGEFYSASCPPANPAPGVCSSIPVPDADPLDVGGHGTHVGSVAAGLGKLTLPQGVAPGATLLAAKVFGSPSGVPVATSSAVVLAALEFAVDPDQDGDTGDHADVINLAVGGSFGRATEFVAVATDNAVVLGSFVATAAGNSGDIPYVVGAAAAASRAMSVAAGSDPGSVAPDELQGFTSRGPRFGDGALKPDITAPGGMVFAAGVGRGSGGIAMSGTSVASAHVAGAAALLRQLHPDWTADEIKAVLMNTAINASPGDGVPYPLSRMGAGRVRVDEAAASGSLVLPASLSFGVLERDRQGQQVETAILEVRNHGTTAKRFALGSSFLFAADDEGSVTPFFPSTVTVPAGKSVKFPFHLRVSFDLLVPDSPFEEYEGFLTLTERTTGGDVLRVPFHLLPYARSRAGALGNSVQLNGGDAFTIANIGLRGTIVDIYRFGVSDPNEDLIAEAPGLPNDPDDWFDVRQTGVHRFTGPGTLGTLIEFAVATHGRRSVANAMITDVFIDVNGGGEDYRLRVADSGRFQSPATFTGTMVAILSHLPSGAVCMGTGCTSFVVPDDRNTALQTAALSLTTLNTLAAQRGGPQISPADPDFSFWVRTIDIATGSFDETDAAAFDVLAPDLDASPQIFTLAGRAAVEVAVLGSAEGRLLVLYRNDVAGAGQTDLIEVQMG